MASVALASCTKTIPVAYDDGKDVAITFEPISNRIATKGNYHGEQNGTYTGPSAGPAVYEDFKAWAFFTAKASTVAGYNPQGTVASANGGVFFSDVTCVHNAGDGAGKDYWEPSPNPYYWPKAGYLHFHAFSPADFTGVANLSHDWANGFTLTGYVAPQYTDTDAAGLLADDVQNDLLYSDFVFDQQRSQYSTTSNTVGTYDDEEDNTGYVHDGINLTFRHALSSVLFKVKTFANYQTGTQQHKFTVRKIEVLNAYNTGNFHENRANTADNKYTILAAGDWSNKIGFYKDNARQNAGGTDGTPYWDTFSNEVTLTPYNQIANAAGGVLATTSAQDLGMQLLTLPQALAHASNDVKVKVYYDYEFSNDGGTSWYTYSHDSSTGLISEIELKGNKGEYASAEYTVNNWLINHKYVYTLVFKLDPIIFDPKVEVFVNVTDINVDLPQQNS